MFAPALGLLLLSVSAELTPLGVVKSADAEVERILASREPTVDRLAAKADEYVDFVELARRALGEKAWAGLSTPQQGEFSATMRGVLRASYAQRALSDGRGGSRIEYGAERVEGNEASVATSFKIKDDVIPVVYRLFRANPKARWKIYDVITDEVSLVATYGDQFRQVIAKKGFDGLLKSLKAKREQLEASAKK